MVAQQMLDSAPDCPQKDFNILEFITGYFQDLCNASDTTREVPCNLGTPEILLFRRPFVSRDFSIAAFRIIKYIQPVSPVLRLLLKYIMFLDCFCDTILVATD